MPGPAAVDRAVRPSIATRPIAVYAASEVHVLLGQVSLRRYVLA
ncbi:MAG: hypothetical protein ACRDPS_09660 [Nocardioides sp.]